MPPFADAQANPPTGYRSIWLWLALVTIGIGWGATSPLSKLAMSTGHHPIGVSFWHITLATSMVTAILLISGGRLPLDRRHLVFFFICGVLGRALPNSLNYAAFAHLPVGVVVLVDGGAPMATLLIALVIKSEQVDIRRLIGLGLGASAIMMILLPRTSLPSPDQTIWVALPIAATLSYAAQSNYIATAKPPDCNALTMICGMSWGALIVLTPIVAAYDAWIVVERVGAPEFAIAAGSILNLGAYFGFVWLIGQAGPVFASQIGYIITGSGIVLGIIVYGERHSVWIWLALMLMFVGLALVKPKQQRDTLS